MKNKIFVVILGLLLGKCGFSQIKAQTSEYSFGIEGALPVGDFKLSNKFGLGGSIKYAYNFTENAALSLQVGYLHFTQKDSLVNPKPYMVSRMVPILVGFRYTLNKPFYIEPQFGAVNTGFKYDTSGRSNQTNIGYGMNVGYRFPSNWDLSVSFKGTSNTQGSLLWVGLKLAYTLNLKNDPYGYE